MQLEQVRVPSTDPQQLIMGAAFDSFAAFQDYRYGPPSVATPSVPQQGGFAAQY